MPLHRPFAHHLLRTAFLFAVDVYYRRERIGKRTVPAEGPVLLVGNHPNGLVDPLVLASTTHRTVRFLGKAPLFELPVLGTLLRAFQALPVVRRQDGGDTRENEATFEAVFDALGRGELVCLFPEGRSHDEPRVLELRTGAARMALGAEARAGFALGVRVVPVGLVYRAKRRFRSAVATHVGTPIDARAFREEYQRDERAAVRALTERIAAGLEEVTLALDSFADLPLLEFVARLEEPGTERHLATIQRVSRRVRALRAREDDPLRAELEALAARVAALHARIGGMGLDPHRLVERYTPGGILRFGLRTLASLLLLGPPALLGMLLWAPPYHATASLTRLRRPGRDVHATVGILTAAVLFPLWWLALGVVAALLVPGAPLASALGALVLLPALGAAALLGRDRGAAVLADAKAFLLLGRRRRLRALLVGERARVLEAVLALGRRLDEAGI